jgi:hypothetical protein
MFNTTIFLRSVQTNPEGGGSFLHQHETIQENSSVIPISTHQIQSANDTSATTTNDGINNVSTLAASERRNIYGLPHPSVTTTQTTSSNPDDHVFAIPSTSSSNTTFTSTVNSRYQRPHSYHTHSFNQVRNHRHHHDQAHHSLNHHNSNHYTQAHHTETNGYAQFQGGHSTYQKHSGTQNLYPETTRHRTLSEHR